MKAILTILAVVASLAVITAFADANPAMMKKDHPGYPSEGTKATNLFGAEALEAAVANEPKDAFTGSLMPIKEPDQLKREGEVRLPIVKDPGYVNKGVTESHIKDATKAQAEPK
jgi:hypothetical protein